MESASLHGAAAMGFNGISTALLACSNPIGTIFSSLFISYITVGGTKLSTQYYSKEIRRRDYRADYLPVRVLAAV